MEWDYGRRGHDTYVRYFLFKYSEDATAFKLKFAV